MACKRAQSWWLVNGLLGRANELRAGELAAAGKLKANELIANELRAGEYQPHADCPTEAGTYRKVLTLHPVDKNAMIMGKKV